MRILRLGQTQLHSMRSILNGSRRYYIALALVGAIMFSPLVLRIKADPFAGPGTYSIRSVLSGRGLDIDLRSFRWDENGRPLIQWDYNGGWNQQFVITPTGDGYYLINVRNTNRYLDVDVSGASTPDGPVLQQWTHTGGDNQKFRIVDDSGYYRIEAKHNGRCLDVRSSSRVNGAQIFAAERDTRACRTKDSQLFSFVRIQ